MWDLFLQLYTHNYFRYRVLFFISILFFCFDGVVAGIVLMVVFVGMLSVCHRGGRLVRLGWQGFC